MFPERVKGLIAKRLSSPRRTKDSTNGDAPLPVPTCLAVGTRGRGGDGKEVKRRGSGLSLGLYFRIKGFQALSFIGISRQNIEITVSIPNEVQRCRVRQNPVPQWQQPEIADLIPNVNPSLSNEDL